MSRYSLKHCVHCNTVTYSRQTFPWTICRSVRTYVHAYVRVRPSVCPVHCGKTADRIRQPFGIVGRTGLGMRQVVGFGDRSTGRGTFGGEFGARVIVTNGDRLYGVRVRQHRDAALFPNYFGQTCYRLSRHMPGSTYKTHTIAYTVADPGIFI